MPALRWLLLVPCCLALLFLFFTGTVAAHYLAEQHLCPAAALDRGICNHRGMTFALKTLLHLSVALAVLAVSAAATWIAPSGTRPVLWTTLAVLVLAAGFLGHAANAGSMFVAALVGAALAAATAPRFLGPPHGMNKRLAMALAAFVGWMLITFVGGHIHTGEAPILQVVTRGLGWPFLLAVVFLLALVVWQQWSDVGLNKPASGRSLLLAWLPMLYIVGVLGLAVSSGLPPAGVLLWILINSFLVGLSEELMFRGVLLQALRHTVSIWPAVVLTTLAFGAVHVLNVFMTGELRAALMQSAAAALSGLLFIALRLRTGSLWPSIVVHFLWDFASLTLLAARSGGGEASSAEGPTTLMSFLPILLVLPNALYGLWLMRRISQTHAQAHL